MQLDSIGSRIIRHFCTSNLKCTPIESIGARKLHFMKVEPAKDTSVPTLRSITRALELMSRPAGEFDAQRYFRGDHNLRFYNVGTTPMRAFARSLYAANRHRWSVD